jgi:cytosine/adenosine deaminase-related metal-dependent hydrolase
MIIPLRISVALIMGARNYILASVLIKSNYLTPDGRTVLKHAVVRIDGDRIVEVRRARRERVDWDAGNALLMPGLVNAHCHLELSYARGMLTPGRPIGEWLIELVATYLRRDFRASTRAGLKRPMATHVSETRDEARYLFRMDGRMKALLEHFKAPAPFARPPRLTPIAYLDRLGVLKPRVVLIHTNYLSIDDVARIARRGCSTVFCPGSHAFFGHRNHPVRRLLRAGVPVALGTDSLASNSELSMLREMRLLREGYGIDAPTALRMATRHGAMALFGRRCRIGELRPGWAADLTCVAVRGDDPLETATLREPRVKFAMAAGRWVRPPS